MTAAVETSLAGLNTSASASTPSQPGDTVRTEEDASQEAPPSPVRPPVSPITPATTFAQLATPLPPNGLPPLDSVPPPSQQSKPTTLPQHPPPPPPPSAPQQTKSSSKHQSKSQSAKPARPVVPPPPAPKPTFIPAPNPVPFEESDNTDAAALRAAIAVLQIQKEKSRKDIKTLQELRQGLLKDPDTFTDELLSGRLREDKSPNDPLHATFASANQDDEGEEGDSKNNTDEAAKSDLDPKTSEETASDSPTRYPPIPSAQNIVRCPPINWAKYHIAGEPLERMHEEQRKRPSAGEPVRDASLQQQQLQQLQQRQQPASYTPPSAEHHVFAPYEPWRDKPTTPAEQLGLGTQARRVSKKGDSGGRSSI